MKPYAITPVRATNVYFMYSKSWELDGKDTSDASKNEFIFKDADFVVWNKQLEDYKYEDWMGSAIEGSYDVYENIRPDRSYRKLPNVSSWTCPKR